MDAAARYRAILIAETCTECFGEHGTHDIECSEFREDVMNEEPAHANCRQRPCPYCKSILKAIDEADEPETDDRYFGFGAL